MPFSWIVRFIFWSHELQHTNLFSLRSCDQTSMLHRLGDISDSLQCRSLRVSAAGSSSLFRLQPSKVHSTSGPMWDCCHTGYQELDMRIGYLSGAVSITAWWNSEIPVIPVITPLAGISRAKAAIVVETQIQLEEVIQWVGVVVQTGPTQSSFHRNPIHIARNHKKLRWATHTAPWNFISWSAFEDTYWFYERLHRHKLLTQLEDQCVIYLVA